MDRGGEACRWRSVRSYCRRVWTINEIRPRPGTPVPVPGPSAPGPHPGRARYTGRFPSQANAMRASILALPLLATLMMTACTSEDAAPAAPAAKSPASASAVIDEHSYAQPDKVVIKDLTLSLKVDFDTRTLAGVATYQLDWKDGAATA